MKRAYSVDNVLNAKFNTLEFEEGWYDAIGNPELTGSWFVYGDIKNGKTSFAMQLAKYLTKFERVAYNSVEEGLSLSVKSAYIRCGIKDVAGRFILLHKETVDELIARLNRPKSPNVVVVDTVQFWELTFADYKRLKSTFPRKLFIYISHTDGRTPDGATAKRIWRDANVAIRIDGFVAFPKSRYGGGTPKIIWGLEAQRIWGLSYGNWEKS